MTLGGVRRLVAPVGQNRQVQIPAKADYAIRSLLTLADSHGAMSAERLARDQNLPPKFLGAIMSDLRREEIVRSRRGAEGGFELNRPADQITVADVLRALSGPMAGVRGQRPETLEYEGLAQPLRDVWVAVRASLRDVLEHVTIADIATNNLPEAVTRYTSDPDAWTTHTS